MKEEISVSGHGSNINTKQSKHLSYYFIKFLDRFSVCSILDMLCGDFLWMNRIVKNKKIKYLGVDKVEDLIKKNKKNYEDKNINFLSFDLANFKTEEKFDLVFM